MISLETKTDVAASSPISLSTPDEEPNFSFSELLKGASKKDDKVVQNGSLVLSLSDEKDIKTSSKSSSKSDTLLSLLKGSKDSENLVVEQTKEPLELNPKITDTMTSKEVKALISDAKQYLKSKILESDGYKQSQIKELPKTLRGLATMAKNFGIDVSKLSLEEVKINTPSLDSEKSLLTKEAVNNKASDKAEVKIQVNDKSEKVDVKNIVETTKQTPLLKLKNQKSILRSK